MGLYYIIKYTQQPAPRRVLLQLSINSINKLGELLVEVIKMRLQKKVVKTQEVYFEAISRELYVICKANEGCS